MNKFNKILIIVSIFLLYCENKYSQIPAFPEADGWGKYSAGGRGGEVFFVTNLSDDGVGSFRYAVEAEGARTVIFKISGTIELKSPIEIKNDSITIAGQTAPGDGICIKRFPVFIKANHVVIRYIRFRLGDEEKLSEDALSGIFNNKYIIIDHCSLSWGIDEVMSFYNNYYLTVQWNIISESLYDSYHHKDEHGYGAIWGGTNVSFHHNLFAHHSSRTPRFSGSSTTFKSENLDFRNNVIFNWGYNGAYGGENSKINIVGNYYKSGPATKEKVKNRIVEIWDENGKWFIDENVVYGFSEITENNWNGGVHSDKKFNIKKVKSEKPFSFSLINYQSPEEAYILVLNHGGASLPKRDLVDKRIINDVKNGTATFEGESYKINEKIDKNIISGIIDSQNDVGGWPLLNSVESPIDTDNDGIPDVWENTNGLDPNNKNDANFFSPEGYTFLEIYLNELGKFNIN